LDASYACAVAGTTVRRYEMLKTLKMTAPKVTAEPDTDSELFMMREHTAEEIADYDAGFKAGECGDEPGRQRASRGRLAGQRPTNKVRDLD
jgi:hypothetical protein